MATLVITASDNFSGETLTDIDLIRFETTANSQVQFAGNQFGTGLIADDVTIVGNLSKREVFQVLSINGNFSAAGWTLNDWTAGTDFVALVGGTTNDTITGSVGDDSLQGRGGLDRLFGGLGNDEIGVGVGTDLAVGEVIDGGVGEDTLFCLNNDQVYNIALANINSIERLFFTFNPTVVASGDQFGPGKINTVDCNAIGTQTLTVEGSLVSLSTVTFLNWGGPGQVININGTSAVSNILNGSDQNDSIFGAAAAADTITGGLGRDDQFGGTGNDLFRYLRPEDIEIDEIVSGQGGTDVLGITGAGDFDLTVLDVSSVEVLQFFSGNCSATLLASQVGAGGISKIAQQFGGHALVVKGDVVDMSGVSVSFSATDTITINGTSATANTLVGSDAAETLNGLNASIDAMTGGGGADTLNGGLSADTFHYLDGDDAEAGELVNGGTGTGDTISLTDTGAIDFSAVTVLGTERLVYASGNSSAIFGGNFAFQFLVGGAGVDELTINASSMNLTALSVSGWTNGVDRITFAGTAGTDNLQGTTESDLFLGGTGLDSLNGNGGVDIADYSALAASIAVDLNGATAVSVTVGGTAEDSIRNIENVLGGSSADTLVGDAAANLFAGNAGTDTLEGVDGADTLDGGSGKDTLDGGIAADSMTGGLEADTYFVDDIGDVLNELAGQGFDTVNTTLNSFKLGANLDRVDFIGIGNFIGQGNLLANRFVGGGGVDRFVTSDGADTYGGGLSTDTVDYRTATTGAVLNFKADVIGGAAAGDIFGSIEKFLGSDTAGDAMTGTGSGRFTFAGFGGNDTLAGANSIDVLQGGGGDDRLIGGAGVDTLQGDAGIDNMTGGSSGDIFLYVATGFDADTVTDYQDGLDTLKVFSAVADAFSDFSIAGNSTTSVTVSLVGSPGDAVTLNAASAITITAADFLFF